VTVCAISVRIPKQSVPTNAKKYGLSEFDSLISHRFLENLNAMSARTPNRIECPLLSSSVITLEVAGSGISSTMVAARNDAAKYTIWRRLSKSPAI
jgi:hypothetical protein